MPDFQPTPEVICSSPYFQSCPLYWSWFCHFCRI
jgi:hypothetical protein